MTDQPITIIGGGIAGLSVAKILNENGISCVIVERTADPGGHARQWACKAGTACRQCFSCLAEQTLRDVKDSPKTLILAHQELDLAQVNPSNLRRPPLKSLSSGQTTLIDSSGLVLALGFEPYDPGDKVLLQHGRLPNVRSLAELEADLRNEDWGSLASGSEIAFLQCVGSREASSGANYCSQYCCGAALRSALKLSDKLNNAEIVIFYIDLQLRNGRLQGLFDEALRAGIKFIQGVPGEILMNDDGKLEVIVEENGRNTRRQFERIILSTGQRPPRELADYAEAFLLPLNEHGFIAPLSDSDTSRTAVPGLYLAGACSGPKDIQMTIDHAHQTASAILQDIEHGVKL